MRRCISFGFVLSNILMTMTLQAYAGEMGNVKEVSHNLELAGGVVVLQPTVTNLDYAVLGIPLPVQSPNWDVSAVAPDYSAGFYIEGRYWFNSKKNDIRANWTRLTTNDSDATFAGNNEFVVPLFQAGPSAGQSFNNPSQQAQTNAQFHYNVIHVDAGQYFAYGQNMQLRLYGGVSGAQIRENLSTTFQDYAQTYFLNSTNNSKFTGVGPTLGLSGQYALPYNLGIIGEISASGLIGTLDSVTNYTSSSPQLAASGITTNYQSISPRNVSQLVPSLEGKLGLNYHFSLNNMTWFIEAGYEYSTYFNALATYNPSTVFGEVNLGTIALSSLNKWVSNFSINGPFAGLRVRA